MGVPKLVEVAQRSAVKNIDSITDVGDLPYPLLRPILRKITNPEQLRLIEEASPHLAGAEDGELWRAFIKRDIQKWQDKTLEPKNPASWWKVYRKLKREDETQRLAAEQQLKAALTKKQEEKDSHRVNIVHAVIPQKTKAKWGEHRSVAAGPQALKNAKSGTDRLAILRRQTANASQSRNITKATPSHELSIKRSTVDKAPPTMVQEYRKMNNPVISPPRIAQAHPGVYAADRQRGPVFVPRKGPISHQNHALSAAITKERQEQKSREDRLRALTSAKTSSAPAASARPQSGASTSGGGLAVTNAASPHRRPPSPVLLGMPRKRAAPALFMPNKKVKR